MFNGDDYLEKKRRELGLDRMDELERIQVVLDRRYPGKTRAKRLHQGILLVVTPSAAVASELRMHQIDLIDELGLEDIRLHLRVGSLD